VIAKNIPFNFGIRAKKHYLLIHLTSIRLQRIVEKMETGDRIVKDRNIANEVLEGIREIKSGRAARRTVIDVPVEIKKIRENLEMSQAEFASLLCVTKRTLQEWEQGRCKPTGAALKLLLVASRHPEALHV
jgi:putative transcriptional regulator